MLTKIKHGCFERCCGSAVDEDLNDFTNLRCCVKLVLFHKVMISRSSNWGSMAIETLCFEYHILNVTS